MSAKVFIRWLGSHKKPSVPPVVPNNPTPVIVVGPMGNQYREMWASLHKRGLTQQGKDDSDFLEYFEIMLPCGQCRRDWQRMTKETPADFNNYFAWTVARHNEVNRMLKKPELTVEEALKIWI